MRPANYRNKTYGASKPAMVARTVALGLFNEELGGAVLDAAPGVHELGLGEHLAVGGLAHTVQTNQWRVPNRANEAIDGLRAPRAGPNTIGDAQRRSRALPHNHRLPRRTAALVMTLCRIATRQAARMRPKEPTSREVARMDSCWGWTASCSMAAPLRSAAGHAVDFVRFVRIWPRGARLAGWMGSARRGHAPNVPARRALHTSERGAGDRLSSSQGAQRESSRCIVVLSSPGEQAASRSSEGGGSGSIGRGVRFASSARHMQRNVCRLQRPLPLQYGGALPEVVIRWEQWGDPTLPASRTVYVMPSFSHSSHVCSSAEDPSPGWWEGFVGPGKAIDTKCAHGWGGVAWWHPLTPPLLRPQPLPRPLRLRARLPLRHHLTAVARAGRRRPR